MPVYLSPGVYVEEIERGPRPIEGVATSVAAFLGETERGPLRPRLVTSYNEYRRSFGDIFKDERYMPHSVSGFFENGGKLCYVCRIVGDKVTSANHVYGDFTVKAIGPGAWGSRVWVRFDAGSTSGFRMKVAYWSSLPATGAYDPFDPANRNNTPRPQLQELFDDLSVDLGSINYYKKRLIDANTNQPVSALVGLERTAGTDSLPALQASLLDGAEPGGGPAVDDPTALAKDDFVGGIVAGNRPEPQGLTALKLDPFRDVSLVYAPFPPASADDIYGAIKDHCELQRFCFAVLDTALNQDLSDFEPRTKFESQYAAMYAPWLWIADPSNGVHVQVPPSGHVLGIYARSDAERGVHKAPANETVRGALDLSADINDSRQEVLNPRGVNAIRRFPGRGIRVWGARTLSANGLWKYVSVRRLFIFLERSIYEGTQWVVFEPNDDRLWARVRDTIRLFLRSQWRGGALFGRTEDEAFTIVCDRTTMTQDDILNGRLICEIGIAPVRPAEFVVFRIFQATAESQR
jgi:uncharacterized protein